MCNVITRTMPLEPQKWTARSGRASAIGGAGGPRTGPPTPRRWGPLGAAAAPLDPTSSGASHRPRQRRELAAAPPELPLPDLVLVLEESPGRRSGSARAVLVVRTAVTGAHEQPRLREPSHRAAEVRAVDREYLELVAADTTHPARDLRRRPIPGHTERVVVRRQARLPLGEGRDRAELDPCLPGASADRSEDVADDRNSRQRGGETAQRQAEREQESATRRRRRERVMVRTHGVTPPSAS